MSRTRVYHGRADERSAIVNTACARPTAPPRHTNPLLRFCVASRGARLGQSVCRMDCCELTGKPTQSFLAKPQLSSAPALPELDQVEIRIRESVAQIAPESCTTSSQPTDHSPRAPHSSLAWKPPILPSHSTCAAHRGDLSGYVFAPHRKSPIEIDDCPSSSTQRVGKARLVAWHDYLHTALIFRDTWGGVHSCT